MKKFKLSIENPCNAKLQEMQKTDVGFFCSLCTKEVVDMSKLSQYEISNFISQNRNQSICARLKTSQLEQEFSLIEQAKINTGFKYAAVAASVLAVSSLQAQEKTTLEKPNAEQVEILGKVAVNTAIQKQETSFIFSGKILNKITQKPLSIKEFENLEVSVVYGETLKYDPKTGSFSIIMSVPNSIKTLDISLYSNDKSWYKQIEFSVEKIKNGKFVKTIMVNPKEFQKMHIAGGLGINYINNK